MAASERSERCKYCRGLLAYKSEIYGGNFHHLECPVNPQNDEQMAEWKEGYHLGFDDNYIEPWRYRNFSQPFLMGYHVGSAEIDRLVEAAIAHNYGYDYDPEEED